MKSTGGKPKSTGRGVEARGSSGTTVLKREDIKPNGDDAFPVVGIGASAGGVEALLLFLGGIKPESGMAYVIILHQNPAHESGPLVEVLQGASALPVALIRNGVKVVRDHIYVAPSGQDAVLREGALCLQAILEPRSRHRPIDHFFTSLAEEAQENGIGVLLSGMGYDGTQGLRAIKQRGGLGFAQEPGSAPFHSMPRNAVEAGLTDGMALAQELPSLILTYVRQTSFPGTDMATLSDATRLALEKIMVSLRMQTGTDFSMYKKKTLCRRIERRTNALRMTDLADYAAFVRSNPTEAELLARELLIGVTCFFRDPPAWEQLKDEILPRLLSNYPSGTVIRAWSAGCASGQEPYSLAMIFHEVLEQIEPDRTFMLQVFATDLDQEALERARTGIYPFSIEADVSPERLDRFFVKGGRGYRIVKEIRDRVVFAPQNVLADPPFTKLDLLLCRNLLIYLEPELQQILIPLFHYSLKPGGYLFLGHSETVGACNDLFEPLAGAMRFYKQLPTVRRHPIRFPSAGHFPQVEGTSPETCPPAARAPGTNLQAQAEQLLLHHYAPPAVLTNDKGDILFLNGPISKYLKPASGKADWNLFVMAGEGFRYQLTRAFRKAQRQHKTLTIKRVAVDDEDGSDRVDVTLHPIVLPSSIQGMMMVVFRDAPPSLPEPPMSGAGKATASEAPLIARLKRELREAKLELRITLEEMQSANEELKSAGEEMQSTNEELCTSKEEMLSLNEELQTLNNELNAKLDELTMAANDLQNLVDSTDAAALFLDGDLQVRRFTPQVTKIFKLLPGDAGRPITDIVSELDYPELADDARHIFRTLGRKEKVVFSHDQRRFRVRIMPYRTLDNHIDGLVISFDEIAIIKEQEMTLGKEKT